ncbi:MAG: translocation/assembly module TamB domain-containing protein [bacterium]|nr:translocation/assembly module TamB domain-containing protein [bacterium]
MALNLKKIAKLLTYSLGSFILLVVLLLLLLQTDMVKRYLLGLGVDKVNSTLNGELTVGGISGSLFGDLELTDITIVRQQDTICGIQRIKLGYQLSPILDQQIMIDSVIIDSVTLSVRQYADSSWNLDGLMKPDSSVEADLTASDEPFGFTLLLNEFMLRNTAAEIVALDTSLHLSLGDILVQFSGSYADTAAQLSVQELQVQLNDPLLRLERLAFDASQKNDILTISNLIIETKRNRAGATANYAPSDSITASGTVSSQRFDFTEFAEIFPEISIAVAPQIALTSRLVKDSLYSGITISDGPEVVDLAISAWPVSYLLSEETLDSIGYRVEGELRNIDIARWTGDSTFLYQINGIFDLNGQGTLPEKMTVDLTADLGQCTVMERRVDTASAEMHLDRGILSGTAMVASDFGKISLDSLVADIFNTQAYHLEAAISSLNLAPLLNSDSLNSDINLTLRLNGQGFDTATATGSLALDISRSSMFEVELQEGSAALRFEPNQISIDTLWLNSALATVNAGGEISAAREGKLDFALTVADLSRYHAFAGTDSLGGHLSAHGTVAGSLDSLTVVGSATGGKLWYQITSIDSLACEFDLSLVDSTLRGNATLRSEQVVSAGYPVDSVRAEAIFSDGLISSKLHLITPDGLAVDGEFDLPEDSILTVVIQKLAVKYLNQQWSGGSGDTRVSLLEDSYRISNLSLASQPDSAGNIQRIVLDGLFSLAASEDLKISYEKIDLAPIASLMEIPYPLAGHLSGNLHVTGTAAQPTLTGRTVLSEGLVQKFFFDSLALDYQHANDSFHWNGLLDPGTTGELATSGFFPLHLSLTDSADLILPDRPMEMKLTASQLPFSILGGMTTEMTVTGGVIDADITVGGTWNKPDMAGKLSIQNAGLAIEDVGVEYDNLALAVSFNDNRVILDSLIVARGKGFMRATGHLEFESDLMSGALRSTDFDLVADKIFLARHSNFEIQISGNSALQGSTAEPKFSGEITIDRSKFYVPFLTEMATKSGGTLDSPPMLISALYPDSTTRDSSNQVVDSAEVSAVESLDYYRNLRGALTLNIPRNTWLKSPEMNIEISGDIRMVKESPDEFELFGPITVVRGKYTMYGKEFVIREGTLTFTGGAEYNPDLNLIAQYVFRSPEREKHTLVATITGKAFTPLVAFSLDGSEIPERDALAYVVFGRSMDEVTASGTGGGSGDMAKGVAANVLAGQLASTLGKSLALDVVEIDASSSLAGATITLGKYLTTDLFMSYQRGVGNPSEDEVTPVIVTLEYELTRNLALQLLEGGPKASGFDVVLKFAW